MKKIIKSVVVEEKIIELNKLVDAERRYYGFERFVHDISSSKDNAIHNRGFITQERFQSGMFICRSMLAVTRGNGWVDDGFTNMSLIGLIESLINISFTVYQFDTPNDLMKWLSGE